MTTPAYLPPRDDGRSDRDPDRLVIAAHLHVLWRNRVLLAGCAVLGGVVALAVTLASPRRYEADAAVAISRPKIGDALAASDLTSTANFRPLIESRAIAAQVIKDTGLDQAPYFVSPGAFFGVIVNVEEVRASSIMTITGRLDDPERVARVVNRVAELGVETARRISQQEALQARNDIKLQLDEARVRLESATKVFEQTRIASQLELVRSDVNAALGQRDHLLELLISIETEKAKLAKIGQELAKRKRVEVVRRSIDSDPALMEAARSLEAKPKDLVGMQISSEQLSTVYQDLDQELAFSTTRLATLEKEKAQLDSRKLSSGSLGKLNDLYAKETVLGRLETERDLANEIYKDMAKSYETARLTVVGRTSALVIVSPAIPPDRPESRKLSRALLIGVMSGLLLAAFFLLVVHAFRSEDRLPQGSRA